LSTDAGTKAGTFRRWLAATIDPFVTILAIAIPTGLLGGMGGEGMGGPLGMLSAVLVLLIFFVMFGRGLTPGKFVVGEKVVDSHSGGNPGFVRMLLREVIGKFVSGLFLGLGFCWATWDKDNQAWHDKIAGTVVVRRRIVPAR
jgi:uncharacterized RDD family membrane protein YckC